MMEWNYSMTQQIYTADEIGQAGLIQSIAFDYAYTQPFSLPGVKVYMKNVSKNTFDNKYDMVAVSESDKVFEGTFAANGAGWVTLTLDTPFYYDGTSNLLVCFYDCTSGHLSSSYKFNCTISTKGSLNYYIDSSSQWYFDIQELKANYNSNAAKGNYRNNIRLTFNNNSIITFADPNVKQICVQNWDTNNDGELSYAEAAAVTSLGEVFKENSEITSFNELQYFTGIQSIGEDAFAYCYQLASITFPPNLSSIGDYAFTRCALTSITLPFSVISIGNNPFILCYALESITMGAGPNNYLYCEGNAIIDINHTLLVGCKNTVIPEGVTTIGSSAFYGCTGLTAIDLPNTVTSIGHWAFNNCTGLTAFTIPASVTSIGANAFYFDTNIAEMTVLATTPPTLGDWVFPEEIADIPVYVPCGAVEAYQTFNDGYPWGSTTFNGTTDVGFTNFQCRVIENFPFEDDFATDGDWLLINGDLTNRWVWGEAGVRNDPHLYISNNDGTSNQYTITSPAMVYATKLFHFEEGWYSFQYDWLAYGEKSWDYLRVALVPASVELSAGTSAPSVPSGSFYNNLPSGWIALDGGSQLSLNSWWQTTYREINVPSGDYLMVFAWRNDNSVGTQPPAAIDNVSIRPVTCPAPTQLTAQFVGATQVTLDWTPSGDEDEWEVWLSGTSGDETFYIPYTATTHPFTLTGLTAGRTYTANVYAVCGTDNAGLSSNEISFTTSTNLCDNPITLPFTENFDGYTGTTSGSVNILPNCWSRINTTTASNFTGYPSIFEYSSYAHSGNNFLFFMSNYNNGDDPQDQYAILPVMENTNGMALNLYARAVASNRVAYFEVGVMTDPTDASTFTALASYQPTSTTYTYYSIPLGFHIGDGIYIAIKIPATSSEVQYRGVCIDDITIEPLCDTEDQCSLTFTLTDSYGDTWNGNAINVVDVETGVVLASMTNVTNDHANAPITETYALAVCDGRELRFDWVKGNYTSECSYTITDANGTVILQGTGSSSMNTGDVLGTYTMSCAPMPIFLTDGNWNDSNCWSTGSVPAPGSDVEIRANVTIPAGYTAIADYVELYNVGSITIEDGGQLRHNSGGFLRVTMKKNIVPYTEVNGKGNYHLLAFPFCEQVAVPAAMTATEGYDFYKFDPNYQNAEWRNNKKTPIATVGGTTGYLYASPEPIVLSLTGRTYSCYENEYISVTVPYTEGSSNLFNGWALLGNPFTCEAYVYSFDYELEYVPMEVMVYDANGRLVTLNGGPIRPMQGFFVKVTQTTRVYIRNYSHPDFHYYVDLGLPSGTLWATCNVGADTPEGYGDYFAWGETAPKDDYSWDTYQHCNGSYNTLTKYCNDAEYGFNGFTDNLTTLLPEDDAATANWGDGWRMPTEEEFEELYNNTTVTWTTRNGVNGRLFTSSNGNSLFLPAAGRRYDDEFEVVGDWGNYWSRSLITYAPTNVWYFFFNSFSYDTYSFSRDYGLPVRPVRNSCHITVAAHPNNGGTVTGAGTFFFSQSCTVTATPNEGYVFLNWMEDGEVVSSDATYTFTVEGSRNLVAHFAHCIGGHAYVDLDLPSGMLWATCNVGADTPESYGDYFAWGETTPKDDYSWSTYQYCNGSENMLTKYCNDAEYGYNGFTDNLTTLLPEDDAATANWGNDWRIPAIEEWQELVDNTTCTWTTQNGVKGRLFTASNGNSIFMPAAGFFNGSSLSYTEYACVFWSNPIDTNLPSTTSSAHFNPTNIYLSNHYVRYIGVSVRPVCNSCLITVTALPNNSGNVTGEGTFLFGQSCTVTATPNEGCIFVNWTEDGEVVSSDATYTFTVEGSRNLVANFATYIGGHEYVDLGLPSGTLWSTCNVGANVPEDYGDYFAWGETQLKSTYDWSTYQYCNGSDNTLTKYCSNSRYGNNGFTDDLTTLLPEDDAATANWGNGWRMPTKQEWQELYNNTTVTWITRNGVDGSLFTASNGNSLFLPAAGYYDGGSLYSENWDGNYWSSSLDMCSSFSVWRLRFDSGGCYMYDNSRDYGHSVRPVRSSGQN